MGSVNSDYDTFPLNHFLYHGRDLPHDGVFTVYAGFVPCLVSGNVSFAVTCMQLEILVSVLRKALIRRNENTFESPNALESQSIKQYTGKNISTNIQPRTITKLK